MKEGVFGQWKELAKVSLSVNNYFVRGLDEKKIYYFKVRAVNDNAGIGAYSKEIRVTTRIPETPEITYIEALSPSKIMLKWKNTLQNDEPGSGYIIERKLNALNYYTVIAILPPNSDTYIDEGLSSSRRYDYRIKAFNKAGESLYSKNAFAITKSFNYFEDVPFSHPASEAIYDLAGRGVIKSQKALNNQGNAIEVFYPDEAISRAEFIYMLVRAFKFDGKAIGSFTDVTYGHWYYNEVMIAKNLGIIKGDELNYFYPEDLLTYGEMESIINKAQQAAGRNLVYQFDYKGDTNGIKDTYVTKDTEYKPVSKDEFVTKGEAAVVIYNIVDSHT